MIRIIFTTLIGIHGLIHILGFVKAFKYAAIKELTLPISRSQGLLWLLSCLLFISTSILFMAGNELWWLTAGIAVLISQVLVIVFWRDAKFGTIPNAVILLVSVVALAEFGFERGVSNEVEQILSRSVGKDTSPLSTEMITSLPEPVEHWLKNTGVVGKERVLTVRLEQHVQMKMQPDQQDWTEAFALQYFTTDPPAFIWKVDMQLIPLVNISGRDRFMGGKGGMLIKLLWLVPVVNSSDNEKINKGTLQRYLGEIVWFPSAAVSPFITWEKIDALSAKASMTYMGTTGSGIYQFDEHGNFLSFRAERYMGGEDDAQLREWVIAVKENKIMNGIKIPAKMEVTWKLDSGAWTWLKLEITRIEYNETFEK